MTDWLIYVAHGADCFRHEAIYSIYSMLRQGGGPAVLVVTDDAPMFRRYLDGLGDIRYVEVDREQLQQWRGGEGGYVHRIKPHAILHAAAVAGIAPQDSLLFVDSDTAFRVPAAQLYARIAAGEVLLNECEGRLCDLRHNTRSHGRLHDAVRQHGAALGGERPIPMTLPLWNSGIIGIRGAELAWIEEALPLVDRLWSALQMPASEQVALSAVLERHGIRPHEVLDEVLHYHVFKEFRDDLAAFFRQFEHEPPARLLELSALIDPVARIQPKLAFNRLPKWRRQLRKAFGRRWQPLPYPWATDAPATPLRPD